MKNLLFKILDVLGYCGKSANVELGHLSLRFAAIKTLGARSSNTRSFGADLA